MTLRALIWDLEGTVAETEIDGHLAAYNCALQGMGLSWRWNVSTYRRLLAVPDEYERLLYDLEGRSDAPRRDLDRRGLARAILYRKHRLLTKLLERRAIGPRPGVLRLLGECRSQGLLLALTTRHSLLGVDPWMSSILGPYWTDYFVEIVCANSAAGEEAAPQLYAEALCRLHLASHEAIAIDDSPKGVCAAAASGVATLATRSLMFRGESYQEATGVCDDLDSPVTLPGGRVARVDLEALQRLHEVAVQRFAAQNISGSAARQRLGSGLRPLDSSAAHCQR